MSSDTLMAVTVPLSVRLNNLEESKSEVNYTVH